MQVGLHGVAGASLDADAVVALQIAEARALRTSLIEAMDLDRGSLDMELLRRLAQRFGREAVTAVERLVDDAD